MNSPFPENLDRTRFPIDPWRLREILPTSDTGGNAGEADTTSATLFALANGYLGVRGDCGKRRPLGQGTFINGFHETYPIKHPENTYGQATLGQVIQGVPDVAGFEVAVDGVVLTAGHALRLNGVQEIDFRTGIWVKRETWQLPNGAQVQVENTRMVSLANAGLAVFSCQITSSTHDVEAVVASDYSGEQRSTCPASADPRQAEHVGDGGLVKTESWTEANAQVQVYRCENSGLLVAVGVSRLAHSDAAHQFDSRDGKAGAQLHPGQALVLTTFASYRTPALVPSGIDAEGKLSGTCAEITQLAAGCRSDVVNAAAAGAQKLEAQQRDWLSRFWERGDVRIETSREPGATAQAIRWALFQLAQASAQVSGHGIPAKGLSGSGYSGHYFWDTEIYVLPFLAYTNPAAARSILEFRHAMLPAARRRAAELDITGALFPWRTINGEEASAYFPAGTAQFHIDADIAFAVSQYVAVTGDKDFRKGAGLDILVETARMWASFGFWQTAGDRRFHIHGVTGPDEYTAIVNDNLYTNVMARFNLRQAAKVLADLAASDREAYADALGRLNITEDEPIAWEAAAKGMYLGWDAARGIHPQDDSFLSLAPWDFEASAQRRPLLLHYHPLVIYRHQVIKQADVLLALFLRGNEFEAEAKRADYDFYAPITTHDSTLSPATQAILAAEVGHLDDALRYFEESLFIDLADRHGNTADGVHLAAAAGIWSALVSGFGGLRDFGECPTLNPRLPPEWTQLQFCLYIQNSDIQVTVEQQQVTLFLRSGPSLTLEVCGNEVKLFPGNTVRIATDSRSVP